MKKFWRDIFEILDDILAYVLTVVGILFSNALTLMTSNEPFKLDMGLWRIAAAMVIAFVFVGQQEQIKPDATGNKATSREGRRHNFKARMVNALAHGFMWSQATEVFKLI